MGKFYFDTEFLCNAEFDTTHTYNVEEEEEEKQLRLSPPNKV